MKEPFDFSHLEALLDEHEAVPAIFFGSPEAKLTNGFIRVLAEESGAIRLVIETADGVNEQVVNRKRLRARIDDPQD